MAKPFEWRDFNKKYNDLSSNNFPAFDAKKGQVQDTLKFKFASKAQKGVKFDSSFTNTDATKTAADFSAKLNIEELKGVELSFKAKNKPALEFSVKLDDTIVPVAGSSFTLKLAGAESSEQTVGGSFGFANHIVNLNLGVTLPLTNKLFEFIGDDENSKTDLAKQRVKVDLDVVAKPVEHHDVFLGGNVQLTLPKEGEELLYTSKIGASLKNGTFNGGAFVEHNKALEKTKTEEKDVSSITHKSKFGVFAYSEVDDLSGGAQVTYTPAETKHYKGFAFEAVAGLQRDADSKLSSKVQIIPETVVSLGYEQKLSSTTKLSFGYAFLLAKAGDEKKTKSSAYNFGLELSH